VNRRRISSLPAGSALEATREVYTEHWLDFVSDFNRHAMIGIGVIR
jgi:hypothetical protein